MRLCKKNQIPIWYSNTFEIEEEKDEYGDYTGNEIKTYTNATLGYVNLYPASGTIFTDVFGLNQAGDFMVAMIGTPFTAETVFYKNQPTNYDNYDYYITSIKPSLNITYYLLKELDYGNSN